MASQMLGRCVCPECGFQSAHIKKTEGKESAKAYRYCPECGAQYFPRNNRQETDLLAKLRKQAVETSIQAEPDKVTAEPEKQRQEPESKPEKRFKSVFGQMVEV